MPIKAYPNPFGGMFYDLEGYGHEGRLEGLTRKDLERLKVDISCQFINEDFDENGRPF